MQISIKSLVLEYLKSTGPVSVSQIVAELDQHCTHPDWYLTETVREKRTIVRNVLIELMRVSENCVSIYSHDPVTTYW